MRHVATTESRRLLRLLFLWLGSLSSDPGQLIVLCDEDQFMNPKSVGRRAGCRYVGEFTADGARADKSVSAILASETRDLTRAL